MTGNQVEQLESRVRELEATLTGLTDELVDTKDRLQAVERAAAGEEATGRRADIVEGDLLGGDESERTDAESEGEAGNDGATGTQAVERADTEADDGSTDTDDEIDADDADEETDGIIVA